METEEDNHILGVFDAPPESSLALMKDANDVPTSPPEPENLPPSTGSDIFTLPDGRPVNAISKKEAKALFSKKDYKVWKKAVKRLSKKQGNKHHDKEKKKEKKKKVKKEKSKKQKSGKKFKDDSASDAGSSDDGFKVDLDEDEQFADEFSAVLPGRRKRGDKMAEVLHEERMRKEASKAKAKAAANNPLCVDLVERMRSARLSDYEALELHRPPLGRLALLDEVLEIVRSASADDQNVLVRSGLLKELSEWIYDTEYGELAPLGVREVALDILLLLNYQGCDPVKPIRKTKNTAELESIGVSRENLINTNLGSAITAVRAAGHNSAKEKSSTLKLFSIFTRVLRGGGDDEGSEKVEPQWPGKGTIKSPYYSIMTEGEVFMRNVTEVDPQDPLSFIKSTPLRLDR